MGLSLSLVGSVLTPISHTLNGIMGHPAGVTDYDLVE